MHKKLEKRDTTLLVRRFAACLYTHVDKTSEPPSSIDFFRYNSKKVAFGCNWYVVHSDGNLWLQQTSQDRVRLLNLTLLLTSR